MKQHGFPNGLTVAELKRLVADWPEVDEHGDPFAVWLGCGHGTSNVVTEVWPLNGRENEDGTKRWADLLLEAQ
jgi:hypothetical protein